MPPTKQVPICENPMGTLAPFLLGAATMLAAVFIWALRRLARQEESDA